MSTFEPEKQGFTRVASVEADNKGRVTINKAIAHAVAGKAERFALYVNEAGQIVLDPTVEIPRREQWIYKNPRALAALKRGLASATNKPSVDLGSFAKYANDDADE